MTVKENDLGGDLGKSYDDVDIFGLDEFGDVGQGQWGPLYGAMIGTGVGTLTAIGVRSFKGGPGGWGQYSEAIGLLAGVVAGGAMLLYQPTRHAGWVAMASAALNNGLRAVEQYMKQGTSEHPLGYAQVQTTRRVGPNALGMADIQNLGRPRRLAGPQASLMGPQASLLGPSFGKQAAHYGASSILQGRE